jgi:squalene-associated FAD-dependent desaturase
MLSLMRSLPRDTGETFLDWLHRHGQTPRAIERFWKTVLVSALNEDLDRMSVSYAAQVFRESFLKSAAAGRMGVPTVPLTELYNAAGDYIRARNGDVQFRVPIDCFRPQESTVILTSGSQELLFDYAVIAVPFDGLERMLPRESEADSLRTMLARFEPSPITGIHLWFDRQITNLDHAVLLDRTIQWMFHKSRLQERGEKDGSYIELVVSSSKGLVERSRTEIIELALQELREFFPAAREAQLLKSTVIKEVHATYSPAPGLDGYRPGNVTAWPGVFLAGDWTNTGWPATMEGAVRSGYFAAQALARAAGINDARYLVPDLPPTGLMRLFSRS